MNHEHSLHLISNLRYSDGKYRFTWGRDEGVRQYAAETIGQLGTEVPGE